MTDEQWLWLFVNEAIDRDEKLEHMCPKCREEVTSKDIKCTRCGKPVGKSDDSFINPNFDVDRYNELAGNINTDDIDDDYDDDCDDIIDIDE